LAAVAAGETPPPPVPPGAVTLPADAVRPEGGWLPAGPIRLRLDIAERIAAELAHATRRGPAVPPPGLAGRLGLRADALAPVLRALGFRLAPAELPGPEVFGPPAPPLLVPLRRRRDPPPPAAPLRPAGPFGALVQLLR
ncbi:MAG: helicase-related protein, partial [Acetobacteraceae bacterium]